MIPRIVHQIWLGEDTPEPPPHMAEASRTWPARNPGWAHRVWGAPEVDALFAAVRPDLVDLYRSYPYCVQRADAARYLILHVHGGVYADFDIACAGPLDDMVREDLVLAPTRPFGLSNDLIMARPGHPLLQAALDGLPAAYRRWHRGWVPPYLRVMLATGPSYFTSVHLRLGAEARARLLTADEYGHGEADRALVRHLQGSTWHAWDARLVKAFWRHRWALALGAAAAAGAAWLWRP